MNHELFPVNNLEVKFDVNERTDIPPVSFQFRHSEHSFKRSAQRGIENTKILAALQYGEVIYKQGLLYHVLGEKDIPAHLLKLKDRIKDTVVIVSGRSNQIITCYRRHRPFKYIRNKSKQLFKGFKEAA